MKPNSLLKQVTDIAGEERNLKDFKEIPCKDLDIDCLALDGKIPFGSYKRCYEYAPELGKCLFHEWHKERSATED